MCINRINEAMKNFYSNGIDIKILEYIEKNQNPNDKTENCFNVMVHALGYAENKNEFEERCDSLIKRGYLSEMEGNKTRIHFLPDEGKLFLREYRRFETLGFWKKILKICEKFSGLSIVISFAALLISILALIKE